jgi:hypothetical protein
MNRDPTVWRSFVRQAKEALSQHPQIRHEWSIDEDEGRCTLEIPEEYDGGFPITVEVSSAEIMVIAGGAHRHLWRAGSPDELAAHALGLVRDLLSPGMRIRERLAAGRPYRWEIEIHTRGRWATMERVGLIFWNYFGKRTERTYQNRTLPARADPLGEGEEGDNR